MDRSSAPQQRDMVFCHRCENEWYRDEHGLTCPECQSEFTEIIEANHDPRVDDGPMPSLADTGGDRHEWYAPDPDEDDISGVEWRTHGPAPPAEQHYHNPFGRPFSPPGSPGAQPPPGPGGLLGLLSTVFGSGQQQQQQQHQHQYPQEQQDWQRPRRPPQQPQQQQDAWLQGGGEGYRTLSTTHGGNTVVRHTSGPGFSVTFTTSTNNNSNLHPRNANSPQPFQHQPETMEQLLSQMFMNIGALPGHGGVHPQPGGPIFMGMGGGQRGFGGGARGVGGEGGFPFGDLLSIFMPPGGVHGDAVYSQDAFDRIVTQLMEQHQTGNAPGPATDEAIDSLPTRPIVAADQGDNGKAECSICMDEAEPGAVVTTLPCDHWFHHECIKAWLSEHDTCPHCRRGIMPKDEPGTNRPRQPSQAPLYDMHSPEYHLPRTPGEFPFSQPDAGEGSGTGASSARSPAAGAGMFSRMREAFGGGGGSGSGSNTRRGSDNYRPQ